MKICMCCMREYSEGTQCPFCGYSREQMLQEIMEFPGVIPPETILSGRFILGRVLSVSDFSVIYLTWDALLRRRVAVREYFPYGLGTRRPGTVSIEFESEQMRLLFEKGADAFEKEYNRLLQNQDIDGIIHIYKVFRTNGTVYAVMEYVEGITLRDILDEQGIEKGVQGRNLMTGIGRIVDLFHERGIVHFNLCPENIFIDNIGQIRILDFSEAKFEVSRMLKSSVNIMDFRYAAPEISIGGPADKQADVYSLGAIWYRIEAGKEPPHSRFMKKGKKGLIVNGSSSSRGIGKMTMPAPSERPVWAAEWISKG